MDALLLLVQVLIFRRRSAGGGSRGMGQQRDRAAEGWGSRAVEREVVHRASMSTHVLSCPLMLV